MLVERGKSSKTGNHKLIFVFVTLSILFVAMIMLFVCGCINQVPTQTKLTYDVDNSLSQSSIATKASSDNAQAVFEITSNADNTVSAIEKLAAKKTVDIRDYGAIAHNEFHVNTDTYKKNEQDCVAESDLAQKNTKAIYSAICEVSKSGGGRVVVPAMDGQVFYTSAIRLEDNVELHIQKGATLKFTTDYSLYQGNLMKEVYGDGVDECGLTLTRFESVELMNYSPFIYAYGKKNIAITGDGVLDGQASTGDGNHPETMTWHQWKQKRTYANGIKIEAQDASRAKLYKMGQENVPVEQRQFGIASGDETSGVDDGFLRPNFIQPYNCQNVVISDVQIKNSPMWEINPVLCDSVVVQNTNVQSHLHNNDGCDPECSSNVVIRNNVFDVGDDCIAIKSGRNGDGLRVNRPSYNIVVVGNTFKDGHGGITIGSEITAGVSNVFSDHNSMDSNQLEAAYRFKTNYIRGGEIQNIYYKNDTAKMVKEDKPIISVNLNYDISSEVEWMERFGCSYSAHIPSFANVYIDNLLVNPSKETGKGGKTAMEIKGFLRDSIADSCQVDNNVGDCYVGGFHISNSTINCSKQLFNCEYVRDMQLDNVNFVQSENKDKFKDCCCFVFNNCNFVQTQCSEDILHSINDCVINNCKF